MPLSNRDFALLQNSIDAIMEKVASLHLSLVIERDFGDLVDFLKEHDAFVYPSFDPDRCDLEGDCFWFRLTDMHGRTVASHADRIYESDDFCSLMETGELWFGGNTHRRKAPPSLVRRPSMQLSGRIGHSGALWVDKAYRGQGLSLYLPYLSRSLCLRNFATTFHTGLVFKSLAGSKVPSEYYGYPHVDLCMDGYFPPTEKMEQVYLCWISQQEAIDRLRALPRHPQFPVALDGLLSAEVGIDTVPGAHHQHIDLAAVLSQRQ